MTPPPRFRSRYTETSGRHMAGCTPPENERYNLHVILNLARADIASATSGQGDGSLLLVIPQAGYLPADDNEVEDGDEGKNRQP